MKTLHEAVCDVSRRLDDYPTENGQKLWTHAELELYVEDGYNRFCRETRCVFDMFYPENVSPSGNFVARWERECMTSGMISVGPMNFTGGYWERDYAEASDIGPIRSTQPWEDAYIASMDDTDVFSAFYPVPEDNVTVDRATYDWHTLSAEWTRFFEEKDRDFQETQGDPWRFAMDRDGMSAIRTVPVGTGAAIEPETSGTYGILRDMDYTADDLWTDAIAFWRMNEVSGTRYDKYGDYDLAQTGTVTGVAGKFNHCASFTSTSTYLTSSTFSLGQTTAGVTWAFWIKKSAAPSTIAAFASTTVSSNPPWQFRLSTSGRPNCFVRDGDGNLLTIGPISGDSLADNAWHLVIMTWNQDHDMKLHAYVDDGLYNLESSAGTSEKLLSTTSGVVVGMGPGTAYGWGEAGQTSLVDLSVVWDRALSTAEWAEVYAYDDTDETVASWGTLRETAEHFPMGGQFGTPRRRFYDDANTRVEYFRLGKDLHEYGSELPDRFMKYVEYFAQAKALEREGPGQDLKLSQHFMERYGQGVQRMVLRLGEMRRAVVGKIGSLGRTPTKPALARLPWRYGRAYHRGSY